MQRAIMRDCDHPLLDGSLATSLVDGGVLGEHDSQEEDPHRHYSILTIEDGVVVNVDWGYHTKDEAMDVLAATRTEQSYGRQAARPHPEPVE